MAPRQRERRTPQRRINPGYQGGFTLIEILVVIVILSILGGLAAQTLLSRPDAARVQAAQTDLRPYLRRWMYGWITFATLVRSGLECVVERPNGSPEAKIGTRGAMKAAERSLGFALPVRKHDGRIELSSLGSDGVEGGEGNAADIRLSEL